MAEANAWIEGPEFKPDLDDRGRIIDQLDGRVRRPDTVRERVRQKIVQILLQELCYPAANIGLDRCIGTGSERICADIVVYHSPEACAGNDRDKVFLIGVVRAPEMAAPAMPLDSYIRAIQAQGGFWTNGDRIDFYHRDSETGAVTPWVGIPKYGQDWSSIGIYRKSDLIIPVNLKLAFRISHHILSRSGAGLKDIASEMVRITLAKVEDEASGKEECNFYISAEEFSGGEIRGAACDRVRRLFRSVRDRYTDLFSPGEEISVTDGQLAVIVSQFQQYSFVNSPHDAIATSYEAYVASRAGVEPERYLSDVTAMITRGLTACSRLMARCGNVPKDGSASLWRRNG